jgi:hypothetical protein
VIQPSVEPLDVSVVQRAILLWRVWTTAARVRMEMRRRPLPDVVTVLSVPRGRTPTRTALLSRAVSRGLRIGPWRPRCLLRSLVLYSLLREQGDEAALIIGLPDRAQSPDAHAWVEQDGRDVGPWPGRKGYEELTRYPRPASTTGESR